MDDKKNENLDELSLKNDELNENSVENSEPSDSLQEKDGVKYETSDSWKFDASAPTVDENLDDLFEGANKLKDNRSKASSKVVSANSQQIVINKEPLKFIPLAIFLVAVIAVITVLGIRYYTVPNGKEGKLMNPASVVATVDDKDISVGLFNCYYSSVVNQYEQYANYGYYELDTTKDYSEQYTTDDDGNKITWAEFFKQQTMNQIKTYQFYADKAKAAGVTLTDKQKETIETQIEQLKSSASEQKVTLNEYIESTFGKYASEDTVRLVLEQFYLTVDYKGKYACETKYTDEQIDSFYKKNKTDYYQINFSYLAMEYDSNSDETKAESDKKIKEYMNKITDRASIVKLVPTAYKSYIESDAQSMMESDSSLTEKEALAQATKTYEGNVDGTIYGNNKPSGFSDEIIDWLFSDDTKVGSKNYYVNTSTGYAYILLKTEKATRSEDDNFTVRHILIQPESDDSNDTDSTSSTTEYTDEQWQAAKEKAEKVLAEYKKGDKTEYSFALLAEKYSADTASTSLGSSDAFGGLCENTAKGSMVADFENWCIDKSRKYGDVDIVKTDYGYHLIFFVYNEPSYKAQAIVDMRNNDFDSQLEKAEYKEYTKRMTKAMDAFQDEKNSQTTSSSDSTDTTTAD